MPFSWTASSAVLTLVLVLGGGIFIEAALRSTRLPDVVPALGYGLLLGPITHVVAKPPEAVVTTLFGVGAAVILFQGGRNIQISVVRPLWRSITLLATWGVLVTAAVMMMAIHWMLGLSWPLAAVGAALLAPTDPATLIPVLQRVNVSERVAQTVETESALNDATGAALMMSLLAWASVGSVSWWQPILQFLWSAGIGIVAGGVTGYLALWSVADRQHGLFREMPSIAALLAALVGFAIPQGFGASGFMGAFVAGLVFGNGRPLGLIIPKPELALVNHSQSAVMVIFRVLIFVLLGVQTRAAWILPIAGPGLLLAVVLMAVARPLTVWLSTNWDGGAHWQRAEQGFFIWARETGIVPAILLTTLLSRHLSHDQELAGLTLEVIVVTILVQASTTAIVARRLGLLRPLPESEV